MSSPGARGLVAAAATAATAGWLTAGCSTTTALPSVLECTFQHRPDAGSAAGERTEVLEVLGSTGGATSPASVELGELAVEVTYVRESPEGTTVRIAVTTADGDPLESVLYQVGDGEDLTESFTTHGFTGLHYVRAGDAELQYFCGRG